MLKNKKGFSMKALQLIMGIFLIISIFVFIGIGFSVQYQDLAETYTMAEETTAFIKAECQKFDNYNRGNSASSLQNLLDTADGLNKFISAGKLSDSDFLQEFIRKEHIGGILILDNNLSLVAQADMDHQETFERWKDIISKNKIKDILQHPQKTYIDHVTVKQVPYDMAVVASEDGNRLIMCYSSTQKPASDPYELNIKSILVNNSFYKNPVLAITDGTQVLSTNSSIVEKLGEEQHQQFADIKWKDNQLTRFKYQNVNYYGLRRVYNNYYIYAVYDSKDIFTHRTAFIGLGFMIYLGVGIIILIVQRHFDKLNIGKMEKQLRIINAISTAYDSTFLLHTDDMELEAIRPSERLNAIFEKHPNPYDFLFAACKTEVAQEFYPRIMHFLDLDTIAERLKGKSFLGCELKDCHGTWFSILLVPQKYDADGNIQALLVTTRNIASVKQTEELTFKDQLTGLYNRNYMEYHSKKEIQSDDFPVSLIMADCNYLKRTNDTMGHEYGDLLLQRIANIITETLPQNCTAMRVGGDEFLIQCMQCTHEKAVQIIDVIKQKLIERSDDKLTLSVSFGVATSDEKDFSFEESYKAADQEMYRDKKASRIQR